MKRFYQRAHVSETDSGAFLVLLDEKAIKTRSKKTLALPSRRLADKVAAEWQAQKTEIQPETMPFMTLSSTAIDNVIPNQDKISADLVAYGGSDLVCYRAEQPESLIKRQYDAWQPLIDWVSKAYGLKLKTTAGIIHIAQSDETCAGFHDIVAAQDPYRLTGLHEMTVLSGSLVIGLAVLDGFMECQAAFDASIIDEIHQADFWGRDDEAEKRLSRRRREFALADHFIRLLD